MVNPSWAVMKLIDDPGLESPAYRSELPVKREANSAMVAASPRQ